LRGCRVSVGVGAPGAPASHALALLRSCALMLLRYHTLALGTGGGVDTGEEDHTHTMGVDETGDAGAQKGEQEQEQEQGSTGKTTPHRVPSSRGAAAKTRRSARCSEATPR
jgi:hypothetical protein